MHATYQNRALLGILLLSLGATMANAGSQQETKPQKKSELLQKDELQQKTDPQQETGLQQDTEAAEKLYQKSDVVSAMNLWEKAAKQGYAPAQARLADMLDAAEEDKKAVEWYEKAAKQGNSAGEYGLGLMYIKGEGVKKDVEKARSLILQAANKNYVPAMRSMVGFYQAGEAGLAVDAVQAGIWEDKVYAVLGIPKPASAPVPNIEKKK